ncbi:MAG: hypothetical protein ACP6IY_09375 [Promethearchaeia archaeon]
MKNKLIKNFKNLQKKEKELFNIQCSLLKTNDIDIYNNELEKDIMLVEYDIQEIQKQNI